MTATNSPLWQLLKYEKGTSRYHQMNTIQSILAAEGRNSESMEVGEIVSVDPDSKALMPIVIEKTDESKLSVGHYRSQAKDLMSDPQVIFELEDQNWTPVRYIQDPHIERADPNGLDLDGFLTIWDRNLRRQGYADANRD